MIYNIYSHQHDFAKSARQGYAHALARIYDSENDLLIFSGFFGRHDSSLQKQTQTVFIHELRVAVRVLTFDLVPHFLGADLPQTLSRCPW